MQTTTIHPVFIRKSRKSMFPYIGIWKNIPLSVSEKTTERNTYTKTTEHTRTIQRTRNTSKQHQETIPEYLVKRGLGNNNAKL